MALTAVGGSLVESDEGAQRADPPPSAVGSRRSSV